ncbi:MAG: DUF4124 domain-containing protein [Desulfobacterales bacterium]
MKIRNMLITVTALIFCLCFSLPAQAEFYQYTDDNGVVHYTDDYSTIPEPYQSQIDSHTETPKDSPGKAGDTEEKDIGQTAPDEDQTADREPGEAASGQTEAAEEEEEESSSAAADQLTRQREELVEKKEQLDQQYEALLEEKQALDSSREEMSDDDEIKAYNQKVQALNEKINQYHEKESALKAEIEKYNQLIKKKSLPDQQNKQKN